MEYEKRNCEECGEEFIPKGKNQFGIQKYCSKECTRRASNKKRDERKKIKATSRENEGASNKVEVANSLNKRSLKQEVAEVQQFLYNIKNGNKVITQFKDLAEKIINTMQIMKLDTYSDSVKAVCIDIMVNLDLFLQNQLKTEKDRGVIIVRAE